MNALIDPEAVPAILNGHVEALRQLDIPDLITCLQHAALLLAPPKARPRDEWTPEDGDVLWWHFPVEEPPFISSPLSSDWYENCPSLLPAGYYTHWTPIVVPKQPPGFIIQCSKDPTCCHGEGHEGPCDEIPF